MSNKKDFTPLVKENYLYTIKSNVEAKQFKKFYVEQNGKKLDIMRNGELSCAYFVSSILTLFGLIDRPHGTVDGTEKNLEKFGWNKIRKPKEGCLLLWEEKQFSKESHKHIGFYIGNNKAISNSSKKKVPSKHHWTFGMKHGKPNRKVIAMYWNSKLDRII